MIVWYFVRYWFASDNHKFSYEHVRQSLVQIKHARIKNNCPNCFVFLLHERVFLAPLMPSVLYIGQSTILFLVHMQKI